MAGWRRSEWDNVDKADQRGEGPDTSTSSTSPVVLKAFSFTSIVSLGVGICDHERWLYLSTSLQPMKPDVQSFDTDRGARESSQGHAFQSGVSMYAIGSDTNTEINHFVGFLRTTLPYSLNFPQGTRAAQLIAFARSSLSPIPSLCCPRWPPGP